MSETTELSIPGCWGDHHMQHDVWRIEHEGRRVPGHMLGNEVCHCLTALSCKRRDSGDYVTSRVGHWYYETLNYTQKNPTKDQAGSPRPTHHSQCRHSNCCPRTFHLLDLAFKPLEQKQLFSFLITFTVLQELLGNAHCVVRAALLHDW